MSASGNTWRETHVRAGRKPTGSAVNRRCPEAEDQIDRSSKKSNLKMEN
jgi:hypothetical protein